MDFAEIVLRMKWATASELRWMRDPDRPPSDLLPGVELGPRIGIGGMARVFSGVDRATRRSRGEDLLPGLARNPASVEAFHREAEAAAASRHPSVVDVYYDHVHDGLHHLVMERVEGSNLREPLDADARSRSGNLCDSPSPRRVR
jgi:serine/threonine protein kinase